MQLNEDGIAELQPDSAVRRATLEVERHVAEAGWDQQPRLFALVRTTELLAAQPELVDQLGLDPAQEYTSIESELPEGGESFEESLDGIEWPPSVSGCAVVVERIMLPPQAEADLPTDPVELERVVAEHPERQEVRIAAAVVRDGSRHSTVRAHLGPEAESDLLEGPDLVPELLARLAGTLGLGM